MPPGASPAACFSENRSAPLRKGACQNFCSLPGSFLPRAGFCLRHGGTEKGISPEPGASDSFLAFGARYAREIPACPAGRREDARLFFSRFRSGKGERGRFFPCSVVLRSEKRGGSIFFRRSRPVLPSAPAMFFPGFKNFSARLHHSSADGAGVQKKIRILSLFQERKREVKI